MPHATARRCCVIAALLGFVMPSVAMAEPVAEPAAPTMGPPVSTAAAPLLDVQLGGVLRLRGQAIGDGSLGAYGQGRLSGVPASLSVRADNAAVASGGDTLGVGDLRLRLDPTLRLGTRAAIHGHVDAVGLMVLGSDPRAEGDPILERLAWNAGNGPARNPMAIRRLWATFDLFGAAELHVGRMPDHFGMGLLRNDGRNVTADFQSEVDRVGLQVEAFDLRLAVSRDNIASSPVVPVGQAPDAPAYAMQDSADVLRWVFELYGGGYQPEAKGFAWGIALLYQDQTVALAAEHDDDPAAALGAGCLVDGKCTALVPREASMVWPQAWMRLRRKTPVGALELELEGALLFATFENTDVLAATDTGKTVIAGGLAARLHLEQGRNGWRLDAGLASGEGEGGFGVYDQDNFSDLDAPDQPHRDLLTGFRFHRGFLVDGLLFREVIGAVANAWYARPSWRRRLSDGGRFGRLELELGVMGALAASAGATPGEASLLGIEPELGLKLVSSGGSTARLDFSWLAPGAAFNDGAGGQAAPQAWRLSAQWILRF